MLPVLSPLLPTSERSVCSYVRQTVKANMSVCVRNSPVLQNSGTMSHWLMIGPQGELCALYYYCDDCNQLQGGVASHSHAHTLTQLPLNPVRQLIHTTI